MEGFLPILVGVLIPIGVVALQPDLGNVILMVSTVFVMTFLAGIPMQIFIALLAAAVVGGVPYVMSHAYQMERIHTFLHPWTDPLGKGYHIIQSFIAIGSGGVLGLGLGQSRLKHFYLPLQYSDFIFAVLCEEGGFLLSVFVIILFAILFIRGLSIAKRASTPFSSYLTIGLTMFVTMQAFINIGVVIGVLPVTGIPLTFISNGGTATIMSMFSLGVIQNVVRMTPLANSSARAKPA